MKKALILILVLAIGGAGAYFFLFLRPIHPEKYFPQDTALYLSLHSVKEARANVNKTALWHRIQASPRKDLYRKQLERLRRVIENSTGIDVAQIAPEFRRDLTIGAFPLPDKKYGAALVGYVADDDEIVRFIEQKVDPSLKRRVPDLLKTSYKYQGQTIHRYASKNLPPGTTPCYMLKDHRLMIGVNPRSIELVIDSIRDKQKSLRNSVIFKNAATKTDYKRGVFLFVNTSVGIDSIRQAIPRANENFWSAILQITGIDAVESLGYVMKIEGDGFQERGFVSVRPARRGLVRVYMDQQPKKLITLDALPEDSKVVTAGTLADFARMWDEVNSQLNRLLTPEQYDRWQKVLNAMRGIFNFDIRRDVLEPVGNEFAFSYEPATQPFQNPTQMKYLLILNLRKPDKFQETLDRLVSLAALRGLPKKQEKYKGKNVHVLELNVGQLSASPAYYRDGSWFYIATDPVYLRRSIDAVAAKQSVKSTGDYKKVTSGFPDRLNGLSYTNVRSYLQMYATIIEKQTVDQQNPWLQEYRVHEELEYLAGGLFGSGSYSRIEQDGLHVHAYSSVPSSLLSLPAIAASLPQVMRQYQTRRASAAQRPR